jgi:hypothetical protein
MANVSTVPTKDRADLAHPEATRGGVYFTPRVDIFENDKGNRSAGFMWRSCEAGRLVA